MYQHSKSLYHSVLFQNCVTEKKVSLLHIMNFLKFYFSNIFETSFGSHIYVQKVIWLARLSQDSDIRLHFRQISAERMEVLPPQQPNQEVMEPGLVPAGYWRDVDRFKGHLYGDVYRSR